MNPVHPSKYDILEMNEMPGDVYDESCNDCPGNDTGRIINPEYAPKLKQWLFDNGYDSEKCYIGWWSW